jgi:ethanolamine utilization protein EutA (predicted chaperonin)
MDRERMLATGSWSRVNSTALRAVVVINATLTTTAMEMSASHPLLLVAFSYRILGQGAILRLRGQGSIAVMREARVTCDWAATCQVHRVAGLRVRPLSVLLKVLLPER